MPPSVACRTLLMRLAHTTEKPPNHRARSVFSGMCCTNGTRYLGVENNANFLIRHSVRSSFFVINVNNLRKTDNACAPRAPIAPECLPMRARRDVRQSAQHRATAHSGTGREHLIRIPPKRRFSPFGVPEMTPKGHLISRAIAAGAPLPKHRYNLGRAGCAWTRGRGRGAIRESHLSLKRG